MRGERKVWRNRTGRQYYTWDGQHGEAEVFDQRGRHRGVKDTQGNWIKPAVPGRFLTLLL